MPVKVQINAAGKVCLTASRKFIVREEGASCGCTPPAGCMVSQHSPVMGQTYKLVVANASPCGGCIELGPCEGPGSFESSGSVNRTYYVSSYLGAIGANPLILGTWEGGFFGHVQDDYDDDDCLEPTMPVGQEQRMFEAGFRLLSDGTDAHTQLGGFAAAQFQSGIYPGFGTTFPALCGFEPDGETPTYSPEALWTFVGGSLVVGDEVTVDNKQTACVMGKAVPPEEGGPFVYNLGGTGGTMTITPCPECAVECEAQLCATVALSGNVTAEGFFDYSDVEGDYEYVGKFTDWTGGPVGLDAINGAIHLPAGCHWLWRKPVYDPDDDEVIIGHRYLVVWNDGQDWRSGIFRDGDGDFLTMLPIEPPADFDCTDGMLTGTLTLYAGNEELDDVIATITFSDTCGCAEVTANYLFDDVAWFNAGQEYPPGDYVIEYVRGAMTYSDGSFGPAQGFRINATTLLGDGSQYRIVDESGDVEVAPATTTAQQGTQAAVEAANAGASVTFTHAGGPIGIKLYDSPYEDNALDLTDPSPSAPVFRLCPVGAA